MREVTLYGKVAAGRAALVDDADYDVVMAHRWNVSERRPAGRRPKGPYAVVSIRTDGKRTGLLMHALITGWPLVDHRDGNGLNNQRVNLREATIAQNLHNRRPNLSAASPYKGVQKRKKNGRWTGRWTACIAVNGVRLRLGDFPDQIFAAVAYDVAALEHFGEFARPNFGPGGMFGDVPDGDALLAEPNEGSAA
jgi:hypothetical protein